MDDWKEEFKQEQKEIDEAFRNKFIHQFKLIERPSQISIGKGWYPLMAKLCQEVDDFFGADLGFPMHNFAWVQIKEKFGSLRAYYTTDQLLGTGPEKLSRLVEKYEVMSSNVCEVCGEHAVLSNAAGLLTTRCQKHFDEILAEINARGIY